jgi:hypothetical protein
MTCTAFFNECRLVEERSTAQAQEILDRGCNGFIQKPFHLEKLSQSEREVLD